MIMGFVNRMKKSTINLFLYNHYFITLYDKILDVRCCISNLEELMFKRVCEKMYLL